MQWVGTRLVAILTWVAAVTAVSCGPGTYAYLSDECRLCPLGQVNTLPDSYACTHCTAGTTSSANRTVCVPCPAFTFGEYCSPCPTLGTVGTGPLSCSSFCADDLVCNNHTRVEQFRRNCSGNVVCTAGHRECITNPTCNALHCGNSIARCRVTSRSDEWDMPANTVMLVLMLAIFLMVALGLGVAYSCRQRTRVHKIHRA